MKSSQRCTDDGMKTPVQSAAQREAAKGAGTEVEAASTLQAKMAEMAQLAEDPTQFDMEDEEELLG